MVQYEEQAKSPRKEWILTISRLAVSESGTGKSVGLKFLFTRARDRREGRGS